MSDWWTEIDDEILAILEAYGPMDPEDLAKKLGMSTAAVCSCLSMLTEARKVRIRSVESAAPPKALQAA